MAFDEDELPNMARVAQQVAPWPLYLVLGLAGAAIAAAILNALTVSLIAYSVLLVGGMALLIWYRTQVVQASMSIDGGAVRVTGIERLAVLAIVVGCLANGLVIGLWVAGLELWFQ